MSTKTGSDKLNELKMKSITLIKDILDKKSTGAGGAGGGGAGGTGGGGAGGTGGGGAGGGGGGGKNGLDDEKGVTGPKITGKGNFDDLFIFLIKPAPIDPSMKEKLEKVYNFINDTPDTAPISGSTTPTTHTTPTVPNPVKIDTQIPETDDVTLKIKSIAK